MFVVANPVTSASKKCMCRENFDVCLNKSCHVSNQSRTMKTSIYVVRGSATSAINYGCGQNLSMTPSLVGRNFVTSVRLATNAKDVAPNTNRLATNTKKFRDKCQYHEKGCQITNCEPKKTAKIRFELQKRSY